MPIEITTVAGGVGYASPFVGPIDHTVHVKIDISTLTTDEVDAYGFLKPGVPLALLTSKLAGLIGGEALVGTAVAAAQVGNTGNGTMGAVTVSAGAKAGLYSLEIIEPAANAGTFIVLDPDGVEVGTGNVAAAFNAGGIAFTLADGATDFVAGDGFNITVTLTGGGAGTKILYGVTVEAAKLSLATIPPTNTSLGLETNDCFAAVGTHGIVNRDIAEDNLGRAYTATEIAAFDAAGSHLRLTTT